MEIKIGFTKPRAWFSPFSWAIRLAYGTPYSHVYVEWESPALGCRLIYEAAGTMVHFTSPVIFEQKDIVLKKYSIQISDETRKKLMRNCIMKCGVPYAIKEALGMGIVQFLKLFGIKLKKNPLGSGASKTKCSELVYDVLLEILSDEDKNELIKKINDEQDLVSPLDIDNYLATCKKAVLEA